ncbi:MAG: hypothetical protein HOC77_10625 [Chloroflexi bacterium]|jgi:hypothetical protein|nr:hypothetical protein [Chloroflexota bacterium]MBT4073932.1 hypothetical protein [Chloroflexota bacterium]MBT4515531.1 hypothetical protein [Chloroflexota bacterium]MBT6681319.1 hypothetical protein [Chloroflexota bacterium]
MDGEVPRSSATLPNEVKCVVKFWRKLASSADNPNIRDKRNPRTGDASYISVTFCDFSGSRIRTVVAKTGGAPAGNIECWVEIPFEIASGDVVRPDGAISITRRGKRWTALVEVKTDRTKLGVDQLETYLDVCKSEKFDALISISNQFSPIPGVHPVVVNRRKIQSVELHHLSWNAVLTDAVLQHEHRGVSDPDQAWILSELIHYLEHPSSGAMHFDDMGSSWVAVRDGARNGTLRENDPGVVDVVATWEELTRYLSLTLGRTLGADVQQVLSRREREDYGLRRSQLTRELAVNASLSSTYRVPNSVGDIVVSADLKAKMVAASISLSAPREGRPRTRLNWLIRQLGRAPDNTRIDTSFEGTRRTTSELLGRLREDPDKGLDEHRSNAPRAFRIALSADMGIKKGSGTGSFIGSVTDILDECYGTIVQNLKAWAPRAPRLPKLNPEESIDVNDPEVDVDV